MNQVSLSFYPPRWQERLTPHPRSLTDRGTPLRIVDAVRVDTAQKPAVSCDAFREWLTQQGFVAVDWGRGRVFYRGEVCSVFGMEKEIDIGYSDEAGEITSVFYRFTLSRGAPVELPKWAALVGAMCQKFEMRLGAEATESCSEEAFLAAVRTNRSWREFAGSFGWDA